MLAFVLAFLPTAVYAGILWWLDRYEKEPLQLVLLAFFWGALPAVVLALLAELGVAALGGALLGPDTTSWIAAPIIEELLKALALIGLFRFARSEFNGVIDGIIYGALVGFGFAMSENLLYFWGHSDHLLGLWLVRSILFGSNYALFTSVVGIALGWLRFSHRRWLPYAALPVALAGAMVLHGLHNRTVGNGLMGLGVAWLFDTSGVILVIAVAILAARQELHWLHQELPAEINGAVLDPVDFQRICQPGHRVQVELRTLLGRGWSAYRRLRRFHHLLTELAFLKHQLASGDRDCCAADVERLRAEVVSQRLALAEAPSS